ncbi:MAG: hypothetical protein COU08_00675 [Candidatus Harrisonbacteria bacterium CG10_big_fil_rev_8_21_14_0_10_42_17]|uniref:Uncharacterized protein n=1 Tax=Candidatus Harrisonbacteria bacterium CG10_big_fil_rev_8_21_14_0_10_42_17 TaxID=1974584 RepID=A0A2M6WIX4_9BACT|nr:MAG: hypothetical protein COU08_00675 [Candidatus Harrisonbacteria bacterium CG10_big_fil_rev_8_21_14_0_10_42_17]
MLKLTKTAIKISNRKVEYDYIIAKILFVGQSNTKPQGISNFVLANREALLCAPSGEDLSGENQWAALRAAHQFIGQKLESLILEYLYDCARTHFIKNL